MLLVHGPGHSANTDFRREIWMRLKMTRAHTAAGSSSGLPDLTTSSGCRRLLAEICHEFLSSVCRACALFRDAADHKFPGL